MDNNPPTDQIGGNNPFPPLNKGNGLVIEMPNEYYSS